MSKIKQVMSELDQYVASCGNGSYLPPDMEYENGAVTLVSAPMYACQQVRDELEEFGEVLLTQLPNSAVGVEIGLGYYGSTHMFWRNFFERVVTIEFDVHRLRWFREHTNNFYKQWILGEGSFFISDYSYSPKAVKKLYNFTESIDFLFIDGDHSYQGVLTDWLLYAPLVRSGGIIAFHDSCCKEFGVSQFLNDLQSGRFGETPDVKCIQHSKSTGISYYFKH
jgi:cephalosporin hydroxylase